MTRDGSDFPRGVGHRRLLERRCRGAESNHDSEIELESEGEELRKDMILVDNKSEQMTDILMGAKIRWRQRRSLRADDTSHDDDASHFAIWASCNLPEFLCFLHEIIKTH